MPSKFKAGDKVVRTLESTYSRENNMPVGSVWTVGFIRNDQIMELKEIPEKTWDIDKYEHVSPLHKLL
jgi:hypothetical protein